MSDNELKSHARGSQWRKWDLQVHSPYSYLNNQFGADIESYASQIFERAMHNRVAAIGVTDYFTLDGFRELKALRDDPTPIETRCDPETIDYARSLLLLPNIELRLDVLVDGHRVNMHVIFSDDLDPDDIETHFLNQLTFGVQTEPGGAPERWPLNKSSLEKSGQTLKEQHDGFSKKDDLVVGMEQACVNLDEIQKCLRDRPSIFSGRYVIAVPPDEDLSKLSWEGQAHSTRKRIIQSSHILFSSNGNTRKWALGKKSPDSQSYVKEFGSLKLCLSTSDSHATHETFKFPNGRDAWLCADLSFQGLRQCINEPERRSYIGKEPPELDRARSEPGGYIDQIVIRPKQDLNAEDKWFDINVPFNTGLIAVIGNKGSGKSALMDCIGLAGNAHVEDDFSFLGSQKFRKRPRNLASKFVAEISWRSCEVQSANLDDHVDRQAPERVQYLPQNYIESICNEIGESGPVQFSRELESVVFGQLSRSQRGSAENFRDLVNAKIRPLRDRAEQARQELKRVNQQIVKVEDRVSDETLDRLKKAEEAKCQEVRDAWTSKPVLPTKSRTEVKETDREAKNEADRLRRKMASVDARISRVQRLADSAVRKREAAKRLIQVAENARNYINSTLEEYAEDFESLGIGRESFLRLSVGMGPIDEIVDGARKTLERVDSIIGEDGGDYGLKGKRDELLGRLEQVRGSQSELEKEFEDALEEKRQWRIRVRALLSDGDDCVRRLRAEIQAITGGKLSDELAKHKADRMDVVERIANAIEEERRSLEDLYQPVSELLSREDVVVREVPLNFSASIVEDGFIDRFLSYLNQGRRGSFAGVEEGRAFAERLLEENFDGSVTSLTAFPVVFEEHLWVDQRSDREGPKKRDIDDQLRDSVSREEMYNLVYGLEYVKSVYEMRWGDKRIEQLSPGERGVLLLVFHLVLSTERTPLLIDQPEGNLDNETVYYTLVGAIRESSRRRQVVLVTHNPNLAIVCDANQIIVANIDAENGNRVSYRSGSIESSGIADSAVNILEGTWPAFDARGRKYSLHR